MSDEVDLWREKNREYLALAIEALRMRMNPDAQPGADAKRAQRAAAAHLKTMPFPPALLQLVEALGLNSFEQDVVLACAAHEVDPAFSKDQKPTVASILNTLPDSHWSALDGLAPLRKLGVIELESKSPLIDARIRLAPDMAGFMLGFSTRPAESAAFDLVAPPHAPLASQGRQASQLAGSVAHATSVTGAIPIVELRGGAAEERALLAALLASALGASSLYGVDPQDLPAPGPDLDTAITRWNRFARLADAHLLVTCGSSLTAERTLHRLAADVEGPVFVSTGQALEVSGERRLIRHRLVETTVEERLELWNAIVGQCAQRLELEMSDELGLATLDMAARFRLTEPVIESICLSAESRLRSETADAKQFAVQLRIGCREIVRSRLDAVAEFVALDGDEVVILPVPESDQLAELIAQIRLAPVLLAPGGRRQGVTALFAGPSGTGKTFAARAVARETGLDLYRVDVSSVLSKYIGETEQNLEAVFTAAELGGAILLFDEADALFGKRSEVRDSHDRYANIGVSYLLQRIERAPCPAILTTNIKDALDPAFTRRMQISIDFPFPDDDARREIWAGVFPATADTSALDWDELAELGATGATIQNIARRATFMAAAGGAEITMELIREAARRDARQSGRELAEVGGP